MTAFSDADLDRLADFVGGALDGTPEADQVRRLVATDLVWAEAYASLVTAEAVVRDELVALGAEPLTMPDDVAARLSAALTSAVSAPPAGAPVLDLARARAARRQRRQRWLVGLSAAAAVLVCGGVGVSVLDGMSADNKDAPSSMHAENDARGAGAPEAAPGGASPSAFRASGGAAPGPAAIAVTGRDYGPETVGQAVVASPVAPAMADQGGTAASGNATKHSVPDELSRLEDPVARAACLTAVVGEYGGQVALVDYARFEGRPALVVVVDGTRVGGGRRLVVVVGPDCGLNGAIADERYRGFA